MHAWVQMPKDELTIPGFGIGLYSAGYHSLVRILAHIGTAAEACMIQDWALAAAALYRAVSLEFSMGYVEPPRLSMSMRPCLAAVLLIAGETKVVQNVIDADQIQFPKNSWGGNASVAFAAHTVSNRTRYYDAMSSCTLLFGAPADSS